MSRTGPGESGPANDLAAVIQVTARLLQESISSQKQLEQNLAQQSRMISSLSDKIDRLENASTPAMAQQESVDGGKRKGRELIPVTSREGRPGTPSLALVAKTAEPELALNDGVQAVISSRRESVARLMSARRSSLAQIDQPGVVALDPVMMGDYIVLRAATGRGGYLIADVASDRIGLQLSHGRAAEELNYHDFAFRILPMLNYRQLNELDLAEKSDAIDLSEEQLAALRKRVKIEAANNQKLIDEVDSGRNRRAIKYGDSVQLFHATSSSFLSAIETAAPMDPQCRATLLDSDGGSSVIVKFAPCFKAQSEGSIVFHSHTVVVQSCFQKGMALHASMSSPYSDVPNTDNPRLPKCLQTTQTVEINASSEATAFVISKYARYDPDEAGLMRTSRPFRLFHSESESFLQCSCDPDKDRRYPEGRDAPTPTPAHVPYFKTIGGDESEREPENPINFSAKGVWVFESLARSSNTAIAWEEPTIRIRHMVSGRYLAVDTDAPPLRDDSERWFSCYLVDDAAADGEALTFDLAGNQLGFKTADASKLVFSLVQADGELSKKVPDADLSVRIVHTAVSSGGSPMVLYLHNSATRKAPMKGKGKAAVSDSSSRLVFTSEKQADGIFKVMRVDDEQRRAIVNVRSYIAPLCAYSASLADPRFALERLRTADTADLIVRAIGLVIKGELDVDEGVDWVSKAAEMETNDLFELFSGEPNDLVQRVCKDLKLFDTLFAMGTAAYARSHPKNPWAPDNEDAGEIGGAKGVQKLIYVCFQRIVEANNANEDYIGRRALIGLGLGNKPGYALPWMEVIFSQLNEDLGAGQALSNLLGSNEALMKKYAGPKVVQRFLEMIDTIGPEARFLSFFEAICAVDGRALKSNQELLLRVCWLDQSWRPEVFVETACYNAATLSTGLKPLPAPFDAARAIEIVGAPPAFIGRGDFEEAGLPSVCLRWKGDDDWRPGNSGLFFSPSAFAIPTFRIPGTEGEWVRVEDLSWVLEKERFCELFTGVAWADMEKQLAEDEEKAARFEKHCQFADYFTAQLRFLGKLCYGRSLTCITALEKSFPMAMLCSLCYNPLLPPELCDAALVFLKNLYLDRFPQLPASGRPYLPQKLWIFQAQSEVEEDSLVLPLIRDAQLSTPGSVPVFGITQSHKFSRDPSAINSFPGQNKFFLLQHFVESYFAKFGFGGTVGALMHNNGHDNALTRCIAEVALLLASYGFVRDIQTSKGLLAYLIRVLDGRSDFDEVSDDEAKPFSPIEERFAFSTESPQVTGLKATIISVFMEVLDRRVNFRLTLLLQRYKEYALSKILNPELLKLHALAEVNKEEDYMGQLSEKLLTDFNSLFTDGDGAELENGNAELDVILLDCLMYEDDHLFSKALQCLEAFKSQRRFLVDAFNEVEIIDSEKIPVFGHLKEMISELQHFDFLIHSTEVWAAAGSLDAEKLNDATSTLAKLVSFLTEPEEEEKGFIAPKKSVASPTSSPFFSPSRQVKRLPSMQYQPIRGSSLDGPRERGELGERGPSLDRAAAAAPGPEERELEPVRERQDVLRALGVQRLFVEALRIDYNLSFGNHSGLSFAENVKSRAVILGLQKQIVDVALLYVKGNEKNQKVIFENVDLVAKFLGPPVLPPISSEANRARLQAVQPRTLGAELIIIECLKGNGDLCESIPMSLLEKFASLLGAESDLSTSPYLDLFMTACEPFGSEAEPLPRNQDAVLEVIFSEKFAVGKKLKAYFSGSVGAAPGRLIDFMRSLISADNLKTATKLQARHFTIDMSVSVLSRLLAELTSSSTTVDGKASALIASPHFCELFEFLGCQMAVLAVNPALYDEAGTWELFTKAGHYLLSAMLKNGEAVDEELAEAATAVCRYGHNLFSNALEDGQDDKVAAVREELRKAGDSVLSGAVGLASLPFITARLPLLSKMALGVIKAVNLVVSDDVLRRGGHATESDEAKAAKADQEPDAAPVGVRPADLRLYFAEALGANRGIALLLQAERFETVQVLEHAETLTDPAVSPKGGLGLGSVVITFPMVVTRMVSYFRNHNFDDDESSCLRILRFLKDFLVRARSGEDGEEKEAGDLSDAEFEAYKVKQSQLVNLGVVSIILKSIATHPAGVEGNLADQSIDLLMELCEGGNSVTQGAAQLFITHEDPDNKLLLHFRARMQDSTRAIVERQAASEDKFVYMNDDNKGDYDNAAQTFAALQQLCEGHALGSQNLIREQPGKAASVNLLNDVAELICLLCATSYRLRVMEDAEVCLVTAGLDCLTEATQGPCPGNQEFLASHSELIPAIEKIFQTPFSSHVEAQVGVAAKASAAGLMAACLENRKDSYVHKTLANALDADLLFIFRSEMVKKAIEKRSADERSEEEDKDDPDKEKNAEEFGEAMLSCLTSIRTIVSELCKIPSFRQKFEGAGEIEAEVAKEMDDAVEVIEVYWNEIVEKVSFPKPLDCEFLSEKTKYIFFLEADLSTQDKRMKSALASIPLFMAEMEQIFYLSNLSETYRFIQNNIVAIKWAMYALVVLLNLNIVMASYGVASSKGYRSIFDGVVYGLPNKSYFGSLIISVILGVINLCGYVVIVSFLAMTEVPITIKKIDEDVETALSDPEVDEGSFRDLSAFNAWTVTLIFNVLFIVMHVYNYPNYPANYGLYLFLILGINLPWTLTCVRAYIIVPNTPQTRLFCIIFDVLVQKPFFRNHVVLMFFSINGFTQSTYFPLMLLDIFNNSKALGNILRSIAMNTTELAMVGYVFVITVVIYAQYGLTYFEEQFNFFQGSSTDDHPCRSVVSCFFLIFYHGIPSSSLTGVVLNIIDNKGDNNAIYLARFAFDVTFFIWFGLLMTNVITGIVCDSFASLREEDAAREDTLENECFVCGYTRSSYDDIPNFRGPSFEAHKEEEHELWTYIHYFVYLRRKDKTELNGVESYVWGKMQKNDMSWVPVRTSASVEASRAAYADSMPLPVDSAVLEDALRAVKAEILQSLESTESNILKSTGGS